MITSIDGRLLVDRWTPPASGIDAALLRGHYEKIAARFVADGWIVGRKTMEEIIGGRPHRVKKTAEYLHQTYLGDRKDRKVAVAIDPHGRIHYGQDHVGGDHVIAVLGRWVSNSYLATLRRDGVSYLFAGTDGRNLRKAMDTLGETFGIKALLLEGGGQINGAFLKAGLIDEISVLVYPGIDGLQGTPSIFDFVGKKNEKPAASQAIRHLATETLEGGMVWIRYKVESQ